VADLLLFHYSEEPSIPVFVPRPSKYHDYPVVWAVREGKSVNFLLPRDCPRVTFGVDPGRSTQADIERFMVGGAARVIAIEAAWLETVRRCTLYEYEMPSETFSMQDVHADHYCSRETVTPIGRRVISDVLAELATHDVEFRVLPSLWPLHDAVAHSSLNFSMYRLKNAAEPVDGYVLKFPR
jgi:hypothetical protein